jgi:hypothetical protein
VAVVHCAPPGVTLGMLASPIPLRGSPIGATAVTHPTKA